MEKAYNSREVKKANMRIFDKMSPLYAKVRRQDYGIKNSRILINKYEEAIGFRFLPVDNFLDVGCGLGFLLLNFSFSGLIKNSYGLDISIGMLGECKKRACELDRDIYLVEADCECMPYGNEKFNLIMGHGILHHLPSAEVTIREAYRVLKKGGLCVFTEPNKTGTKIISVFRWIIWFMPYLMRQISKTKEEKLLDITTFNPKELEQIALKIGFSSVFSRPFAGFLSRIIYWILDPITQRVSNKYFQSIVEKIINSFYILDMKVLRYFVPNEWFDEFAIVLKKD